MLVSNNNFNVCFMSFVFLTIAISLLQRLDAPEIGPLMWLVQVIWRR